MCYNVCRHRTLIQLNILSVLRIQYFDIIIVLQYHTYSPSSTSSTNLPHVRTHLEWHLCVFTCVCSSSQHLKDVELRRSPHTLFVLPSVCADSALTFLALGWVVVLRCAIPPPPAHANAKDGEQIVEIMHRSLDVLACGHVRADGSSSSALACDHHAHAQSWVNLTAIERRLRVPDIDLIIADHATHMRPLNTSTCVCRSKLDSSACSEHLDR